MYNINRSKANIKLSEIKIHNHNIIVFCLISQTEQNTNRGGTTEQVWRHRWFEEGFQSNFVEASGTLGESLRKFDSLEVILMSKSSLLGDQEHDQSET